MSWTPYVVTNALLKANPPQCEWHAHGLDATRSVLVVLWDSPTLEIAFEAMPGVIPLGKLWELLPAAAAPLLAQLQPTVTSLDTVATALRKLPWAGGRLVR